MQKRLVKSLKEDSYICLNFEHYEFKAHDKIDSKFL